MEKKTYKVAVTGSSGSGKTTVIDLLREMGLPTVDLDTYAADIIAKDITVLEKLEEMLPFTVKSGNTFPFQQVGAFFDQNQATEEMFESWFQPYLGKHIQAVLNSIPLKGTVFYDAPFLNARGLTSSFDEVWEVKTTKENCIQRIMLRNSYSLDKASYLVDRSTDTIEKNSARIHIDNNGSLNHLKDEITREVKRLQEMI